MFVCLYVYLPICLYSYIHICMYAYMLIRIYAYMHICCDDSITDNYQASVLHPYMSFFSSSNPLNIFFKYSCELKNHKQLTLKIWILLISNILTLMHIVNEVISRLSRLQSLAAVWLQSCSVPSTWNVYRSSEEW